VIDEIMTINFLVCYISSIVYNNVIKDIYPLFSEYKSNNNQQKSETTLSLFGKNCLIVTPMNHGSNFFIKCLEEISEYSKEHQTLLIAC